MIDLWALAMFLEEIAPHMELINGRVFLDRNKQGPARLQKEIDNYSDIIEAQRWINMVPIDDFIDSIVDDWNIYDPIVDKIAGVYAVSWLAIAKAKYGSEINFWTEVLRDVEAGDVIIRLNQS